MMKVTVLGAGAMGCLFGGPCLATSVELCRMIAANSTESAGVLDILWV